jgi:hypothetical protein
MKKLKLRVETLRNLTVGELVHAQGGADDSEGEGRDTITRSCVNCPSCYPHASNIKQTEYQNRIWVC